MTDCFLAGVHAAHPENCLDEPFAATTASMAKSSCWLAGKAAGAMMKVAARHYLRRIDKERICGVAVASPMVLRPCSYELDGSWASRCQMKGSQNGARQALLLASKATK